MKRGIKWRQRIFLAMLVVLSISIKAYSGERTFEIHTVDDPGIVIDDSVCASAAFTSNLKVGANAWTYETRTSDGEIVKDLTHKVGTVQACVLITDLNFTQSTIHPMYVQFDLKNGLYNGVGNCTVASNNVPLQGLILAGCTLRLMEQSSGNTVGSAIMSSAFNPFGLSGFAPGSSYWTLRFYSLD